MYRAGPAGSMVGQVLRFLRQRYGISPEDAWKASNVGLHTLHLVEDGMRLPAHAELDSLLSVYGLTPGLRAKVRLAIIEVIEASRAKRTIYIEDLNVSRVLENPPGREDAALAVLGELLDVLKEDSGTPVRQVDTFDLSGVGEGVFISYRRADEAGFAGRLYDRLAMRFGPDALFMDVDTIEYGLDFRDELNRALRQCRVVLAVIGSRWASALCDDGERRLFKRDDYVRLEIEQALASSRVRVIPILVDGTQMPEAAELPESLLSLRRLNACSMSNARFGSGSLELITTIEGVLREAE